MKKQTAVEWLIEQLFIASGIEVTKENNPPLFELIEQSKAMEKEQMKDAVLDDVADNENMKKKFADRFEQYYNETYGN